MLKRIGIPVTLVAMSFFLAVSAQAMSYYPQYGSQDVGFATQTYTAQNYYNPSYATQSYTASTTPVQSQSAYATNAYYAQQYAQPYNYDYYNPAQYNSYYNSNVGFNQYDPYSYANTTARRTSRRRSSNLGTVELRRQLDNDRTRFPDYYLNGRRFVDPTVGPIYRDGNSYREGLYTRQGRRSYPTYRNTYNPYAGLSEGRNFTDRRTLAYPYYGPYTQGQYYNNSAYNPYQTYPYGSYQNVYSAGYNY